MYVAQHEQSLMLSYIVEKQQKLDLNLKDSSVSIQDLEDEKVIIENKIQATMEKLARLKEKASSANL